MATFRGEHQPSFFNDLFGKKSYQIASEISRKAVPVIIKSIFKKLVYFIIAAVFYILVFRLYVAPVIIMNETHLSIIQSYLWPFFYSIDYFFGTTFIEIVQTL